MSQSSMTLYQSADGQVELSVSLDRDTVWLSQAQMAELFDKDVRTINEHIGNVFAEGELEREATIRKFRIVRQEGKRQVQRDIEHYNLDAIISVGYRVKSQRGVQFRQWATRVLRRHLVDGYTLNERRLAERGVEFEQAVSLLSRTLANRQLVSDEGQAVLQVIGEYARSWSLLQGYDEQSLAEQNARQGGMRALALDDGLASAIATIEQGFGDELFYPNVASRAAHLLYFVIKNHPLADGNKRTGSFLFLWYLRLNQHLLARPVEQLINNNTLVALALLVAESLPAQKELMVRLIEHFVLLKVDEGSGAP